MDINHVVLIGRLTRDAVLKYAESNGQAVTKFSIAVNRRKRQGDDWADEPNFFDIVLWGRQAETLQPYLVKAKPVCIDGELRQDRWTDSDNQNRSKILVVANYIQLLGGGQQSESSNAHHKSHAAPANDNPADNVPF